MEWLNDALTSAMIIMLYDNQTPFALQMDALLLGLHVICHQEKEKEHQVLTYSSRTFFPAKRKHRIMEL